MDRSDHEPEREPARPADPGTVVTVSLISHTNAGKTTLARTLLRRDVGEQGDQPHVTDVSEAYTLVECAGAELRLWDTPGFGDSARLIKRLRQRATPLAWFLHQVWDRFRDRPLYCSQQAVRNVQTEADVVLYLVNANDDPRLVGYVDSEMEILQWIGKPVIVLLNQTGVARAHEIERAERERWRSHLAGYPGVREVISLDAFARCWVQEAELLELIGGQLADSLKPAFERLLAAWQERNLRTFRKSMGVLGRKLVESARDGEPAPEETLLNRVGLARTVVDAELQAVRQRLAARLAERTAAATSQLIALHGLEGRSARRMAQISRDHFGMPRKIDEGVWAAVGGATAGMTGGLMADLASGGLTFGGGALVAGLAGGSGGYILAKGYNLARGSDRQVRWSLGHFREQVQLGLLTYLAVAHFGRGRGHWQEGEEPLFWRSEVKRAIDSRLADIDGIWKRAGRREVGEDELVSQIENLLAAIAGRVLRELYPQAGKIGF